MKAKVPIEDTGNTYVTGDRGLERRRAGEETGRNRTHNRIHQGRDNKRVLEVGKRGADGKRFWQQNRRGLRAVRFRVK